MPQFRKNEEEKMTDQVGNGKWKNCRFLLLAKHSSFCLKLKEENLDCPPRCPFFVEGRPGDYQDALEKQYDVNCLFCTRRKLSHLTPNDELAFFCDLRKNPQSFCSACLLRLDKVLMKQLYSFHLEEVGHE